MLFISFPASPVFFFGVFRPTHVLAGTSDVPPFCFGLKSGADLQDVGLWKNASCALIFRLFAALFQTAFGHRIVPEFP